MLTMVTKIIDSIEILSKPIFIFCSFSLKCIFYFILDCRVSTAHTAFVCILHFWQLAVRHTLDDAGSSSSSLRRPADGRWNDMRTAFERKMTKEEPEHTVRKLQNCWLRVSMCV